MAKRVIDGATLSAIADATRNLTGATGVLTPEQITSQLQAEIDSGKVVVKTCTMRARASNAWKFLCIRNGSLVIMSDGDFESMDVEDRYIIRDVVCGSIAISNTPYSTAITVSGTGCQALYNVANASFFVGTCCTAAGETGYFN